MFLLVAVLLFGCPGPHGRDDTGPSGDSGSAASQDQDLDGFDASEDCDDADPSIHPGATERCNGLDDDCDGFVDDEDPDLALDDAPTWYRDGDGDGFGDPAAPVLACQPGSGWVADDADCDDGDPSVSPAAVEICDGLDDDCDGVTDEDDAVGAPTWEADGDGDGFGDPANTIVACTPGDGWVAAGDLPDCDDTAAAVHPGAEERCDGVDDDCDGAVDEDGAVDAGTWSIDQDGDGYGATDVTLRACAPPTGWVADTTDCDDLDGAIHPGADEHCDGADEDCDGVVDEDAVDTPTWYIDADGDGYGGSAAAVACTAPAGAIAAGGDCDDEDASASPGADELCDGVDNDCDGVVDEDGAVDAPTWYADADGDGYPDLSSALAACSQPSGYLVATAEEDCDDSDPSVHPGATEICDGVDDDCDGEVDNGEVLEATTWYLDHDGDGYGGTSYPVTACSAPSGFVADSSDCDDGDATVFPGAPEACDGVDHDCDGAVNEDDAVDAATWYQDADSDGYGEATDASVACAAPTGFVADGSDCDDDDAMVHPGATETCNGVDDDCDGAIDPDLDGDGWDLCDDCDEGDPAINPGATEACDGADDDCNGIVDDVADADGDGWTTCEDCDDGDASVHPGAIEVCGNGVDDDCDGTAEGCGFDDEVTEEDEFGAIIWGESAADYAGTSLASVGDVDGDGYDDLIVGAYHHEVPYSQAGASYLMLGPFEGQVDLADNQAKWMGIAAADYAGAKVAGGGDLDGDGCVDFVIGATGESTVAPTSGAVYVSYGPAAGDASLEDADAVIYGELERDQLGQTIALVGDTDGDGLDDLLLGSKGAGNTYDSAQGAAYLFLGPLSGSYSAVDADALLLDSGAWGTAEVGADVTDLGDVDGDGLHDVMIVARGEGMAFLLLGPVSNTSDLSADSDAVISGSPYSSDPAGDMDGDGLDDVLIATNYQCSAYLMPGTLRGAATMSADYLAKITSLTSTTCYDFLGRHVISAGDVDGDGHGDLLVDEAGYGYYTALLYLGALAGVYAPTDADALIDPSYDLGGAMDHANLDGDGYDDLLLGSPEADFDGSSSGGVYVLTGGPGL
ncbi:MAG: MopE-related protein [Pseudomonadota bacterium]